MLSNDAMHLRISHLIEDMVAGGGLHPETARGRIASYAKGGTICFKAGTNTSPNLYRDEDSAVAIVLSALQDAGVADHEIQHDAACEIYLRIGRCLAGLANGETWSLVIDVYRGPSGYFVLPLLARTEDQRRVTPSADFIPRATLTVDVGRMLSPVVQRLADAKDH